MKRNMNLFKRIITWILILCILITPLIIDQKPVEAATGRSDVTLSISKYGLYIPSLGYSLASDHLWDIYADGNKLVWCISPHKSCNNHDTYTWTSYNAVTFWNQSFAKALTYYNHYLGSSILNKAQMQAYMWATSMGRSKEQAVYESGRCVNGGGYTWQNAVNFCNAIANTAPEGEVVYYTCVGCPEGYNLSGHQILLGYSFSTVAPRYAETTYRNSKSGSYKTTVNVNKTDLETGKPIDGAMFDVYWDDQKIDTLGVINGKNSREYTTTYNTSEWYVSRYYVTNWNELSRRQQQQLTANGYYDTKAKADLAAKTVVETKLAEELKALENKSHIYTLKEVQAPSGYYISDAEKKQSFTKNTDELTFDFTNGYQRGTIEVKKYNGEVGNTDITSTEASLVGAEYTVTAGSTIYNSDRSVLYNPGDVVGTIVIDDTLTGKLEGLPMGNYIVEETKAPKGFNLDDELHVVNLSAEQTDKTVTKTVESCDTEIQGYIEINKLYDNRLSESGAEFDILNSEETVVQHLVTDETGYVKSEALPYGSYKVTQTVTKEGFMKANDFIVKIDENNKTLTYHLNDEKVRDYSWLKIIKTYKKQDVESGVNEEAFEEGAEFDIVNSEGTTIQHLITDETGYAESNALDAGTYTVKQTKGKENYAFVEDFTITVQEGKNETFSYSLINEYNGNKIRIKKTMSKEDLVEPENNAEFIVFDIEKAKVIDSSSNSFGNYPYQIKDKAIAIEFAQFIEENNLALGKIITNTKGIGSVLLPDEFSKDNNFAIVQINGKSSYKLSGITESKDVTSKLENGIKVYEFELDNPFDEYGYVEINKKETATDTTHKPELNAQFEVVNVKTGEVVSKLTTNKEGYAKSESLEYGNYVLHQTASSQGHQKYDDQKFTLDSENKHETINFELVNPEAPIKLVLTKRDVKTKNLLGGAEYVLKNSEGQIVTTLVTSKNEADLGTVSYYLQYGTYTLLETKAPEGYVKNDKEVTFTISNSTVQYNDANEAIYEINQTNEPIYGYLTLNKQGQLLTGYSESGEDKSFVWTTDGVEGAEYGLYAEEDIISADGVTVYYHAGDLVGQATTDSEGKLEFTQTMDGQQTNKLYLGKYYVQELSSPKGFTLDTEKHSVVLTYDKKAEDLNDITENTDIKDVDDPAEEGVWTNKNSITYKLGATDENAVIATLSADGVLTITGTGNTKAFSSVSNVPWYTDGNYLKIKQVVFENGVTPTNLNYWFKDCVALEDVNLNLVNSNITSMVSTFEGCVALEEAPSLENCSKLTSLNSAFKDCVSLTTAPNLTGITNVTNLNSTFEGCVSLTTVPDISSMTKVTTMQRTFKDCHNLTGTLTVNIPSTTLATSAFTECLSGVSQGVAELTLKGAKWQVLDPIYESKSSDSNVVYESTRSTLLPGPQFNTKLLSTIGKYSQNQGGTIVYYLNKLDGIYFVDTVVPSGVTKVDVSADSDGSAIMYKSGNNIYITSGKTGCKLKANKDCTGMFAGEIPEAYGYKRISPLVVGTLNVEKLETKNTTNMSAMLASVGGTETTNETRNGVKIIGLETWDTSNVTNMHGMFYNTQFKRDSIVNLSNWNTSKVTDMSFMFYQGVSCIYRENNKSYANVKLIANFDTSNVTNMVRMIAYFKGFAEITIRGTKTNNTVQSFESLSLLNSTKSSQIGNNQLAWFSGNVNNPYMDFGKVTLNYDSTNRTLVQKLVSEAKAQENQYTGTYNVVLGTQKAALPPITPPSTPSEIVGTYNIGKTNANSVVATLYRNGFLMITGTGDIKTFNSASEVPWHNYSKNITKVTFGDTVIPSNMNYLFEGCYALSEVQLNSDNVSNLTSLKNTFKDCYALKSIPDFTKAIKLTTLENAFYNCYDLTEIKLSSGEQVTSLNGTFYNCYNLINSPDISKMTQVSNMNNTYYGCKRLDGVIFINNNPSTYTNCFRGCSIGNNQVFLKGTSGVLNELESTKASTNHVYAYGVQSIKVVPLYPKVECNTDLTYDMFNYIATYNDNLQEEIQLTENEVILAPNTVPNKVGKFTVNFDFNGKYNSVPNASVELTAIDLDSYNLEEDIITEVVQELNLTDKAQQISIKINKVDDEDNIVEGATFQLKSLIDIYDRFGNLIVPANTILAEKESDEFGYVNFGSIFPTEVYTKGNASKMYEVKEIVAPKGYTKSDKVFTFSGNIPDNSTQFINYEEKAVNTALDKIIVNKIWDDSNNVDKLRPSSIQIEVLKGTSVVSTVTLNEANNWTQTINNLPKNENGQKVNYTFREKSIPSGYTSSYTYVDGICTFTNTHAVSKLSLDVSKVWEDTNNKDGIRPSSIQVDLYANNEVVKELTLSSSNNWKQTVSNLDKFDKDNNEIRYRFIEKQEGIITGDANTGYSVDYAINGNSTVITNKHTPQNISLEVEKVWDDKNNEDNIRPSSIEVDLLANDTVERTLTLSEDNDWKATVTSLPKYKNGKEIQYEFKEKTLSATNQLKKIDISTDKINSTSNMYYTTFYKVIGNKTIITNKHIPFRPLGKIVLTKRIKANDIIWGNGNPSFIFVLEGTLEDGSQITYSGLVTFTQDYVQEHTDIDGYVTLDYEFLNLEYGTYIASEDIVSRYKLNKIGSIQGGTEEGTDKVKFDINKQNLNGKATFTNDKLEWQYFTGNSSVINKITGKGQTDEDIRDTDMPSDSIINQAGTSML